MHIHIVQHETFEAPGAYLEWAQQRNDSISFSKVYEGQALPSTVEHIDLLLVMGGPQSPDTTLAECPHFDSTAEQALILKCIQAGKAVIGVCLGAQLIGVSLGAAFEHSPEKEIGVFPINLTEEGLRDEKIHLFGSPLSVGHWHNDMPGLTESSKILATSEGCPRQIIAYTDLVYGFQCHMELNQEVVELLISADEDFLRRSTHQFVQKPEVIRQHDFKEMNNKLFLFLDHLTSAYLKSSH